MISVLDLFRIGIGPSSSHTVGPMRIAKRFLEHLEQLGLLSSVVRVEVELQGSLALTGVGHGSPDAVLLGLMGLDPETVDPDAVAAQIEGVASSGNIALLGKHAIAFDRQRDLLLACHILPELHPNGMHLVATDLDGRCLLEEMWYSTGGGFVASQQQLETPVPADRIAVGKPVPFAFGSAAELLALCEQTGHNIAGIIFANESVWRSEDDTRAGLDRIAEAMNQCIDRGLVRDGELPGGLQVRRRAPQIWRDMQARPGSNEAEGLFDWLNVYAMAVNEENAAGGRVVTAPTNGAAGIIPAVLRHYCSCEETGTDKARHFLLTAGGIGLLYKQRASISGAEMGCQGEVGVACSMAAGGLAAIWGGTPAQVAAAAEIAMEHNLGLTCDPVGGLVQIPCIERNAIGAVKAVNAARLALHSHETPRVSLDQVIETMRQTGIDMSSKYKETSQGGLAVNVVAC